MTPERIEELRSAATGARERNVTVTLLPDELEALCVLAESAIPSGQVAEDARLVGAGLGAACEHMLETGPCPHRTALVRLAAQAQSAHEWKQRA